MLEFLNPDSIAEGLSPFAPETQFFRADRLFLEGFDELVQTNQTIVFGKALLEVSSVTPETRSVGYRVVMLFLWLPGTDLAAIRAKNRSDSRDITCQSVTEYG